MPPPSDPSAAHEAVREALAEGRVFAAYDLARASLERLPGDDALRLLGAMALARTGAIEAAREELADTHIAGYTAKKVARIPSSRRIWERGMAFRGRVSTSRAGTRDRASAPAPDRPAPSRPGS